MDEMPRYHRIHYFAKRSTKRVDRPEGWRDKHQANLSKPRHPRTLADHQAEAMLRNFRTSPQKLGLVAGLFRNQPASQAVATLTFSKRRIALQVKKMLQSAIDNAEFDHQLDTNGLVVTQAYVDKPQKLEVTRRYDPTTSSAPTVYVAASTPAEEALFAAAARVFDAEATSSQSSAMRALEAEGIITASGALAVDYR